MSRENVLVSVVTPVYNGAEYIAECIESVLGQTHGRFEYIVMDNCSTDATPDIVASYAAQDERIRFLRPSEFVGPDPNANRALREISGESAYTKVVHADDWMFPECLEKMVALAVRYPDVGIVGAYRLEGDGVSLDGLPASVEVVPGRDFCRSQLLGRPWPYLMGSPSSVLYRSDLVRARPEFYRLANPFQSDQEACYVLLQESDFGFVHQVLTFTRRHDEADSSYYHGVGAEPAGQLRMLLEYGPVFLTQDEYTQRLAARVLDYASLFVRRPARLADAEFRAYHAATIARLRGAIPLSDVLEGATRALTGRLRR